MKRPLIVLVLFVQSVAMSPPAGAQLTLAGALRQADHSAFGNRSAAGSAAEKAAQALVPLKGILPSVRVEAGYVRTTDPIGAFGSILRQRKITQADFDPNRLNYPVAIGNYQGGLVLEQPLFNADELQVEVRGSGGWWAHGRSQLTTDLEQTEHLEVAFWPWK